MSVNLQSLKTQLQDWEDIDIVMHMLAVNLGLIEDYEGSFNIDHKWIYWSKNEYRDVLQNTLNGLIKIGFLEEHPEESQLRYNSSFRL